MNAKPVRANAQVINPKQSGQEDVSLRRGVVFKHSFHYVKEYIIFGTNCACFSFSLDNVFVNSLILGVQFNKLPQTPFKKPIKLRFNKLKVSFCLFVCLLNSNVVSDLFV